MKNHYLGKDHKIRGSNCLKCGYYMDGATGVSHDRQPDAGDITLCIKCRHVMAFDEDLQLWELTQEEQEEIFAHPTIVHMIRVLDRAAQERNKKQ